MKKIAIHSAKKHAIICPFCQKSVGLLITDTKCRHVYKIELKATENGTLDILWHFQKIERTMPAVKAITPVVQQTTSP